MTIDMTFRRLTEDDFPDLRQWLNRPHLRRFFQKQPISLAQIEAKYGPRVRGEEPTHCHLAWLAHSPFGYLQCYRIADYPDWAALIGERDGIGVDLAILEPDLVGQGLGHAMLAGYLGEIAFPLFANESKCFIAHERENHAGIANSRSVGFRFSRSFVEDGNATELLVLERDEPAVWRG